MIPPTPHLFNIVPPVEGGTGLTVHFYAGDILSIPTDILVVSAFKGGYQPVRGTLFGALRERFGFLAIDHPTERISQHLVAVKPLQSGLPFRKLLIVEMDHELQTDWNIMQATFHDLNHHLRYAIDPDDQSISFPLLGTGNQQLPKERSAIEILKLKSILSDTALRKMNVFAYDFEAIALLNTNIETFLRRPQPARSSDPLLQAVVEELKACAAMGQLPDFQDMQEFLQLIQSAFPSYHALAGKGRNIAECFASLLVQRHEVEVERPHTLDNRLKALKEVFRSSYPAFVLSYLRLLQSCGNVVSHPSPYRLESQDIAALGLAVISLSRTISMTPREEKANDLRF